MKAKLKDLNEDNQLLALDVLDYLMVQGKMPVTTQIASTDFLNNLVSTLKNRNSPQVNDKILYLIEKWAKRFESQKDIIPNFWDKYTMLKKSGVIFPDNYSSSYHKYLGEGNYNNDYKSEFKTSDKTYEKSHTNTYDEPVQSDYRDISIPVTAAVDLDPKKYEKKYQQFVMELVTLVDTIVLANVKYIVNS
jgi:hypothetical protein